MFYRRNNKVNRRIDKRFTAEKCRIKAVMITPSLLLQKPSKDSRAKDHTKALERRLKLCTDGHLTGLLKEGETMQSSLKHVDAPKTIAQLSKMFVEQMQKGNVDSAIKLITNNCKMEYYL